MTTLQKILSATALVVATGIAIHEAREASELREQVQMLQDLPTAFLEQHQRLQRERDEATNRLAAGDAEITQLTHQIKQQDVAPQDTSED